MVFNLLVQICALLWLGLATSAEALVAGALMFGASIGNLLMLQPLLIAEAFGLRDYGRIFALANAVTMLGVAAGPLVIGLLYDFGGGYAVAYPVAAGLSVAALLGLTIAGRPPSAKAA